MPDIKHIKVNYGRCSTSSSKPQKAHIHLLRDVYVQYMKEIRGCQTAGNPRPNHNPLPQLRRAGDTKLNN